MYNYHGDVETYTLIRNPLASVWCRSSPLCFQAAFLASRQRVTRCFQLMVKLLHIANSPDCNTGTFYDFLDFPNDSLAFSGVQIFFLGY